MKDTLNIIVINTSLRSTSFIKLPCRPVVGDILPIKHSNEKVMQVCFMTETLRKNRILPQEDEYDLVLYTE